ncbi:MAG: hypothetical protein KGQ66_11960 [Acidobacteriota bacterium]|nr:hypothetical protein [Acidobacteriota bacterium]
MAHHLARLTAVAGLTVLLGSACSGGGPAASAGPAAPSTGPAVASTTPSTTPPTESTTTAPVTAPPTTVYTPTAPAGSPDGAAAALVEAWAGANPTQAAATASPAARQALFAVPYPAGGAQARGCTDARTNPGTCTYADVGSGRLYEIGVTHLSSGWYVSSVTIEG